MPGVRSVSGGDAQSRRQPRLRASGRGDEIRPQHYAFLVSEEEFDEIYGRIRDRGSCALGRPERQPRRRDQPQRRRARGVLQDPAGITWKSSPGPMIGRRLTRDAADRRHHRSLASIPGRLPTTGPVRGAARNQWPRSPCVRRRRGPPAEALCYAISGRTGSATPLEYSAPDQRASGIDGTRPSANTMSSRG